MHGGSTDSRCDLSGNESKQVSVSCDLQGITRATRVSNTKRKGKATIKIQTQIINQTTLSSSKVSLEAKTRLVTHWCQQKETQKMITQSTESILLNRSHALFASGKLHCHPTACPSNPIQALMVRTVLLSDNVKWQVSSRFVWMLFDGGPIICLLTQIISENAAGENV